ncbi:MAG: hypothetical protein H8E34_09275 [Bacteroidetes bacterium]|nr:hypothetical protein [Bacteroidota bacterium]
MTAQEESRINPNGYNIFYAEDSIKVSEGTMLNGKPDGYWINYHANGVLKSEGNRKNFELDSLWKFYNEEGKIILEINYKGGKKNGFRTTHQGSEIIKENFIDDVKQGNTVVFYPNHKIKLSTPFINGLENGIAREYDINGNIIQLITYQKGYITDRERINRNDSDNRPHGKWLWFTDDEQVVIMEGNYKHGLKHGYFKEYDKEGNLISATKFIDGEIFEKAEELQKLEIRTDYYPNGKVKVVATYTRDGVPEGVRREYNEKGEVEKSYIFRFGKIIGEGIFTDAGQKQGNWKEYYNDGSLKATGYYINDLYNGLWKYYYRNGQLEETGKYVRGSPDSTWLWYYNDGKLLREEHFFDGLPNGILTEYDKEGNIVIQGEYLEGKKEGHWIYMVGDTKDEGEYVEDMRNGLWKSYYKEGNLRFEGKFIDDNPNGEHTWYWDNGKIKQQGKYVMGRKNGDWKKFDENGIPILIISYSAGKELKYDGIKILSEQE